MSTNLNFIIDCIHENPTFYIGEFYGNYVSPLLQKTFKTIFWVNAFVGWPQYWSSKLVNNFLDTPSSNFSSPWTILPARICFLFILIGHKNCNLTHTKKSISGYLTFSVTDHLPKFLILPKKFLAIHPDQNISTYMTEKKLAKKIHPRVSSSGLG